MQGVRKHTTQQHGGDPGSIPGGRAFGTSGDVLLTLLNNQGNISHPKRHPRFSTHLYRARTTPTTMSARLPTLTALSARRSRPGAAMPQNPNMPRHGADDARPRAETLPVGPGAPHARFARARRQDDAPSAVAMCH